MIGNGHVRTTLKVVPRTAAVKTGVSRRFQASLALKGNLAGDELVEQLAQYGFDGQSARARYALMTIEAFIEKKLAEGYQLDLKLASFYPKLSGALSARDEDPETDGLYVQGAVTARMPLRHALKNKVEAVNPSSAKSLRIFNCLDVENKTFDEIEIGHVVSVVGHDISIDPRSAEEGYYLEKRSGRRFGKPKMIQKAEILESARDSAKIVFHESVPSGKYNLVVMTRCGETHDYKLRRIGHPIRVRS